MRPLESGLIDKGGVFSGNSQQSLSRRELRARQCAQPFVCLSMILAAGWERRSRAVPTFHAEQVTGVSEGQKLGPGHLTPAATALVTSRH